MNRFFLSQFTKSVWFICISLGHTLSNRPFYLLVFINMVSLEHTHTSMYRHIETSAVRRFLSFRFDKMRTWLHICMNMNWICVLQHLVAKTTYTHSKVVLFFRYRFSSEVSGRSFETVLNESAGFNNPRCIEHLGEEIGLDSNIFYTNMSGLRGKYPNEEYSSELRQSQASSWAFR